MAPQQSLLITGGSGFIGTALCTLLLRHGYTLFILTRYPDKLTQRWQNQVTPISQLTQLPKGMPLTAVINLAGAPIVDRPWTKQRRQLLRQSRIDITHHVLSQLQQRQIQTETVISGSAIGFYGDTGEHPVTEKSPKGQGFAADLCQEWEQAAQQSCPQQTRLCVLRTGVVLGKDGGMLARMQRPFRLGLGGKIGTGQQWVSWIAIEDICQLILFLLTTPSCHGIFNATAPDPVRNAQLTTQLGQALHKPTWLTLPEWLIKTGLGEASSLLLDSQFVLPTHALSQGFEFQYPTLSSCLAQQFNTA